WIFAVIGRGNVQFPDGKAPEERITGTLLPVDSADIQVLMLIGDVPVFHGAALVDCRRQRRSELQGRWIQLARIDFVSGERWRKIFTFTRSLARVGSKARKVAPKHSGCRNITGIESWIGSLNGSLVTAKKEQFVFQDRSAENAAELITLQTVALRGEK